MRLEGKNTVVLGAATKDNMGQVVARFFAKEGAKVTVAGRHEEELKRLADEIGGTAVVADITKRGDLEALAQAAGGPIHAAVNLVGVNVTKPLLETTRDDLEWLSQVHFVGFYEFLQVFCGHMKDHGEGGSIIQTTSATTDCLIENHAAYIATKAAGDSLVQCFANEFGQYGIKVNSVVPGLTDTPMAAEAVAMPGLKDAFLKEYPLGRIGTAEDIAHGCVFLASDESFISGQKLQTNGGLTLRRNPTSKEIEASIGAAMAAQGS